MAALEREIKLQLELAIYSSGEEEVTARLTEMAAQLICFKTPASAELAAEIYRAIRKAWEANRRQPSGPLGRKWERETIEYHTALLEAIRRSRKEVMR